MRIRKDNSERPLETEAAHARMAGWQKALIAKDSGQAMVEMALVLPLLLLILTGIMSFGIILEQYQVLTDAAGDGARAFALSRGQSSPALAVSDPCAYAAYVSDQAATSLDTTNITYTINFTPPGGTMTTYSGVTSASGCAGFKLNDGTDGTTDDVNGTVQVVAKYPVTPLLFGWAKETLNMQVSASEQIQ